MATKLTIKKRFETLLPPLSETELAGLLASILADGVRDPLVIWKGRGIIVDGHNRYRIAKKHGIRFKKVEKEFDDEDAVCIWIIENQAGKRNLTDAQRTFHLGELYKLRKNRRGGQRNVEGRNQHSEKRSTSQNATLTKDDTATAIAKEQKVDRATVHRAAAFHTAVSEIAERTGQNTNELLELADKIGKQGIMRIAKIPEPEKQKAVVTKIATDEAKSIIDAQRLLAKERVKNSPELNTQKKYRIIYADPPWHYKHWLPESYSPAKNHYPTMTIDELCALPVKDLAQDNAVLFLWVTSPFLFECLPVIEAWGFDYKTSFVWDKIRQSWGRYNSASHEFLLVCVRGNCTPDTDKKIDSVQSIERSSNHSEKPEEFREIIDTLYPHGSRIELFARKKVEGWAVWGNEI